MSSISPTPDPTDPTQSASSNNDSYSGIYKNFNPPPFQWGSMYFDSTEAKQFWENMMQMVNSQIQKDHEKAMKASRKLKASALGENAPED